MEKNTIIGTALPDNSDFTRKYFDRYGAFFYKKGFDAPTAQNIAQKLIYYAFTLAENPNRAMYIDSTSKTWPTNVSPFDHLKITALEHVLRFLNGDHTLLLSSGPGKLFEQFITGLVNRDAPAILNSIKQLNIAAQKPIDFRPDNIKEEIYKKEPPKGVPKSDLFNFVSFLIDMADGKYDTNNDFVQKTVKKKAIQLQQEFLKKTSEKAFTGEIKPFSLKNVFSGLFKVKDMALGFITNELSSWSKGHDCFLRAIFGDYQRVYAWLPGELGPFLQSIVSLARLYDGLGTAILGVIWACSTGDTSMLVSGYNDIIGGLTGFVYSLVQKEQKLYNSDEIDSNSRWQKKERGQKTYIIIRGKPVEVENDSHYTERKRQSGTLKWRDEFLYSKNSPPRMNISSNSLQQKKAISQIKNVHPATSPVFDSTDSSVPIVGNGGGPATDSSSIRLGKGTSDFLASWETFGVGGNNADLYKNPHKKVAADQKIYIHVHPDSPINTETSQTTAEEKPSDLGVMEGDNKGPNIEKRMGLVFYDELNHVVADIACNLNNPE